MRHNVYGKHLGRNKNQREALFKGLVRALFIHESIQTTEAKAKAIKGLVDKLITYSRKNTPASKRQLSSFIVDNSTLNKLNTEIAPRFVNRSSGFTHLVRVGTRAGDGAMMVKMSLVQADKMQEKRVEVEEEKSEFDEVEEEPVKKSVNKEKKKAKTKV